MDLESEILSCIAKVTKVPEEELSMDTQIYNSKIVTSLGLMEIIANLEKKYMLIIMPEELIQDNLSSIQAIADFVRYKLGSETG